MFQLPLFLRLLINSLLFWYVHFLFIKDIFIIFKNSSCMFGSLSFEVLFRVLFNSSISFPYSWRLIKKRHCNSMIMMASLSMIHWSMWSKSTDFDCDSNEFKNETCWILRMLVKLFTVNIISRMTVINANHFSLTKNELN